jgi:hypothetical protein
LIPIKGPQKASAGHGDSNHGKGHYQHRQSAEQEPGEDHQAIALNQTYSH